MKDNRMNFVIYILLIGRLNGLLRALWEMVRSELEVAQWKIQGQVMCMDSIPLSLAQQSGFHPAGPTPLSRNHGVVVTSSQ